MNEKEVFLLKYRFRPFLSIIMLLTTFLFIAATNLFISEKQVLLSVLFSLLTIFMLFGGISQILLFKKPYHFLVDRKENLLLVDSGYRRNKSFSLSEIRGVSYTSQTVKGSTTYFIQFSVSPQFWCEFYKKKEQKMTQYIDEYQEMYVVLSVINQKDNDIKQLVDFISESGVRKVPFVPSVLGKYPGKPKMTHTEAHAYFDNPITKKQKRRQLVSYIGISVILCSSVFYLLLSILGMTKGIFW